MGFRFMKRRVNILLSEQNFHTQCLFLATDFIQQFRHRHDPLHEIAHAAIIHAPARGAT
jgi:hypothetical protein